MHTYADEKGRKLPLLETYLELPGTLLVRIDALGDYPARCGSQATTVRMPRIHPSGNSLFLAAPDFHNVFADDGLGHKLVGGDFYWGLESRSQTGDKSSGTAAVFAVGLAATCADGEEAEKAAELAAVVEEWWRGASDWIQVLTGQVAVGMGTSARRSFYRPIWGDGGGTVTRHLHDLRPSISGGGAASPAAPIPLSAPLLKAALARASTAPPIEWLLVRDGRVAHHQGARRRAVLDAGTAAELAITELIKRNQAHLNQKDLEHLLKKNSMLTRRVALFRRLGGVLPSDTTKLVRARNAAAHQGVNLPASVSTMALLTAAEIVEAAYPLASFT